MCVCLLIKKMIRERSREREVKREVERETLLSIEKKEGDTLRQNRYKTRQ